MMSIHFETISEVGKKLRSGAITSAALTELILERIEAHNDKLNAFITVTAELAREQAQRVDEELAQGHDRGPLHGIPIGVKDLFATDGIRTTCGSRLYENWVPALAQNWKIEISADRKTGWEIFLRLSDHTQSYKIL